MSWRKIVLTLVIMLVLLASAVAPMTAHAQEPLPPPDGPVAEEVPPPEGVVAEEVPPTDELPAGEAPPTIEAPTEQATTEPLPPPEEILPGDEATIPEILEGTTEGTEVVLQGENGEPLPLASNEAAEVLEEGDPMWCPDGAAPDNDPGGLCTRRRATFAAMQADADYHGDTQSGTIYVNKGYSSLGTADAGGIFLNDGSSVGVNLTIEGGWHLAATTPYKIAGDTSTIETTLNIDGWGSPGTQLTLRDLAFTGGGNLFIDDGTVANVTLANVTVRESLIDGALIATAGNITVNDGIFSLNGQDGLDAVSGGDIVLNNVITRQNGENGAQLDAVDDITVNLGVYSGNSEDGLNANAGSDIVLNGVIARENEENGVNAWADGDFTVNGGRFSRNGENGLLVAADGNMDISDARARANGSFGILAGGGLNPEADFGVDGNAVTLKDVIANGNYDGGVAVGSVYGGVSLANVIGNYDGLVGVAAGSVYGPVTLNTIYSESSYLGVVGGSVFGDVTIENVETYDHFLGAAGLSVFGDTSLEDVIAGYNDLGVLGLGLGDVTLKQIYAGHYDVDGDGVVQDDEGLENGVGVAALSLGGIELVDRFGLEEENFDFFPYLLGEDFGSDLFGALTTAGSTPGTITLDTIEANGNEAIGVVVLGVGDTYLTNVKANDNAFAGVIDISVGQTLADWLGAWAASMFGVDGHAPPLLGEEEEGPIAVGPGGAGNTTLTNVTTNGNGFVGTLALAGGSASLTAVTANDNGLLGVGAISLGGFFPPPMNGVSALLAPGAPGALGSTTLMDVTASGNGLIGGAAVAPGNVYVGNSVFSDNGFLGLAAISLQGGDVTVYKVYALGNGLDIDLPLLGVMPLGRGSVGTGIAMGSFFNDGHIDGVMPGLLPFPDIDAPENGSSTLICSVATGNSGYGLAALTNTVVQSSVLSPNGLGDSIEMGGEVTVGPDVNCEVCEGGACAGGGEDEGRAKVLLIPAPGCADITLNEGGVTAVLHNLCGHVVTLEGADETDLPGDLPSGAVLSLGGVIVAPDLPLPDHSITLYFTIPSGADPADLAVLFWNGSEWVEVPGGTVVDGMFVVTVTEGGTYVLVQQ